MSPEAAIEKLVQLARKLAWSPYSGLEGSRRVSLRQAVEAYDKAKRRPTAFDHILADDEEIFEQDANVIRCAYSKCGAPMMNYRHGRRKYHTDECRKKAFVERKKLQTRTEVQSAKARVKGAT